MDVMGVRENLQDKCNLEDLTYDDKIEYWHTHETGNSLREFLGSITKEEYLDFVLGKDRKRMAESEPDVREKLVELLDNFHRDLSPFAGNEKLFVVDDNVEQAEYLIAHGVTVQKWISVKDRLPSKEEYTAKAEDGTEYYVRLLIAYKTDIIEYEIGYYDGYKWMTEMPIRLIKDVVAWMPFPNMPQPPKI